MAITMALYFNLIVFLMFIASIGIGMQYNPTIFLLPMLHSLTIILCR